jgi:hypothetical protein
MYPAPMTVTSPGTASGPVAESIAREPFGEERHELGDGPRERGRAGSKAGIHPRCLSARVIAARELTPENEEKRSPGPEFEHEGQAREIPATDGEGSEYYSVGREHELFHASEQLRCGVIDPWNQGYLDPQLASRTGVVVEVREWTGREAVPALVERSQQLRARPPTAYDVQVCRGHGIPLQRGQNMRPVRQPRWRGSTTESRAAGPRRRGIA